MCSAALAAMRRIRRASQTALLPAVAHAHQRVVQRKLTRWFDVDFCHGIVTEARITAKIRLKPASRARRKNARSIVAATPGRREQLVGSDVDRLWQSARNSRRQPARPPRGMLSRRIARRSNSVFDAIFTAFFAVQTRLKSIQLQINATPACRVFDKDDGVISATAGKMNS